MKICGEVENRTLILTLQKLYVNHYTTTPKKRQLSQSYQ